MKILDLFAGLGGEQRRKRIEARGHTLVTVDFSSRFKCDITADLMLDGTLLNILSKGPFDFIWASPPCETFSVASIGKHWNKDKTPKTPQAEHGKALVDRTVEIIRQLNPKAWVIENPRGMMRTINTVKDLPRVTVTYCKYGESRMKPTDLWGVIPGWTPRPACKNGDSCHVSAPRGATTGTQGIKGAAERSVVPWDLWDEILTALESSIG